MTLKTAGNIVLVTLLGTVAFGAETVTVEKGDQSETYNLLADYGIIGKLNNAVLTADDFKPNTSIKTKESVKLTWSSAPSQVRMFVKKKTKGDKFELCAQLSNDVTLTLTPGKVRCGTKNLNKEAMLVSAVNGEVFVVAIPNRVLPVPGSDYGVALTLVDRWEDPLVTDDMGETSRPNEGFRLHGGASAYYSISDLRAEKVRAIAHLAFLDMDEELDFEVGVGVGAMFRPEPKDRTGFSFTLGVGYNFMMDDSEERPYTFVGIGYNVKKEEE